MSALSERLNTPISTAELERRWRAVRSAMDAEQIDVLVLQNNSETFGGYVRWFTDLPASAYPVTVLFPLDGAMTVVMHGPLGEDQRLPAEGNGILRGVERILSTASFPSAMYTRHYDAALAADVLVPYATGTIGLVGTYQMSLAAGEHLKQAHPRARFIEASGLVDAIKAIKSAEEQELIRAAARLQDAVMTAACAAVRPGMRESDVNAVARRVAQELGSEAGIFLSGAAPVGTPAPIAARHLQNRVIESGDVLALLVEVDGPGGQYAELGRTCVVGSAPAALREEFEFARAAQAFTVGLLKPGAACADIWTSYNAFMAEHDRPQERRLHAHGQGYDLVERPLIRFDEDMFVAPGMNFACHPGYVRGGAFSWICDNWLIEADGPGERLHAFPQEIVEL